jgi:uncharacterized phage-associated protein
MHATNNILQRSFDDGIPVTPMKLQRLLYLTAVDYARRTDGVSPFHEPFQAWKYGPVIRSVYDKFQPIGGDPIRVFARDAAGNGHLVREASSPELSAALSTVWAAFQHVTAVDASRIICQPGTVWYRAFAVGEGTPIPDDQIWSDLFLAPILSQRAAPKNAAHR